MILRVALLAVIAGAVAQIGATPATAEPELKAPIHYLGRADPRLCPSPVCGGIWLKAVNGSSGNCSRPRGHECYVTHLQFADKTDEGTKARLTALVTERGGLVRGSMTPARFDGFPDLRALLVGSFWRPASENEPTGVFRTLRDNGVRCVTTPCFSVSATAIERGRAATVSAFDLRSAGASAAERRWAAKLVATRGLVAAGRIVRAPDGGRTFVASQIYLPAR